MKNLIIILLSLVVTLGCDKNKNNETEITPILIGKNSLFGNGEEGIDQSNLVITNSQDWTSLIEQMNSVNNTSDNFTEIDIDFSQFQVIAIFDKVRESAGYAIEITNIFEDKDVINVFVTVQTPSGNDTTVIVQPFHIVKIKISEKPIVFINEV